MRLIMMFGISVVCLSLATVELSQQVRAELVRREFSAEADLDAAPPPPHDSLPQGIEEVLWAGNLYDCPVVDVTLSSITVFYKGCSGWVVSTDMDGEIEWVNGTLVKGERRWESVPPRRIRLPISKDLEDGKFGEGCHVWDKDAFYPVTMVEVGDRVDLIIAVQNGRYVCTGITIWRRPGGQVPRSPWDDRRGWRTHHYEGANALQDLEEKGIPLPLKYENLKDHRTLSPHLRPPLPPDLSPIE